MKGIDIFCLNLQGVMKMGAHRAAGVAHKPYYVSSLYLLPPFNTECGEMAVGGGYSSAVVDPNVFAQISMLAPSINDTIGRCNNGSALATAYVQAVMKLLCSCKSRGVRRRAYSRSDFDSFAPA